MTGKQADFFARIAWDACKRMSSSEVAAQNTIGVTPKDFEDFAIDYLTKAFLAGHPGNLKVRIDVANTTPYDADSGKYRFGDDQQVNLANATYIQALTALKGNVPDFGIDKYKQFHAGGATPYEAYTKTLRWWERVKTDEEGDFGGDSTITDHSARQLLARAPSDIQGVYGKAIRNGAAPRTALDKAMQTWQANQVA